MSSACSGFLLRSESARFRSEFEVRLRPRHARKAPRALPTLRAGTSRCTNAIGVAQKGAFRVEDGLIYHLDADQVVGRAFQDDQGRLHLEFLGHRKIAQGEAVVEKVKDGRWKVNGGGGFVPGADVEVILSGASRRGS